MPFERVRFSKSPTNSLRSPRTNNQLIAYADEENTSDLNGSSVIDIIDVRQQTSSNGNNGQLPVMDMNMYATRKTIAQGMMVLGLMCSNACQLKYVLLNSAHHPYYQVTISLIVICILMEIMVGILFIGLGRLNINYGQHRRRADLINNASVIAIFMVTVTNVLITAFGPSENIQQRQPTANKITSWTNLYQDSSNALVAISDHH